MKIEVFQPPLPEMMSEGGDVEAPRMMNGGVGVSEFRLPANLQDLLVGIGAPQSIPAAASVPATTTTTATTEVPFANSREDFYIRPEDFVYRGDFPTTEGAYEQYIQALTDQLNAGLGIGSLPGQTSTGTDPIVTEETIAQTIAELLAEGTLTAEEIQRRIDEGDITKDDVLSIIAGGFELSENQLAQLFEQGILTREEIEALVTEAIQDIETETEEAVEEAIAEGTTGLTEEQVNQLITQGLEGFDTSQFATQEQLQGLENLFQNYLTPEQLESYLGQQQFVTSDELASATDYDATIKELTDKLGDLETKYQDVQSQYEADAVNQQIQETKEDLDSFFRGAVPSGPRTGSTSQFSSGASFLPGGSPMANLIGGQRQGLGQDAFSTYLKTFTPSYGSYQAPFTAEEYGQGSSPLLGTQYSNPFTGGSFSQGGQVSNGIMDLTNFDTNVAPFQNAFRPNVPRN